MEKVICSLCKKNYSNKKDIHYCPHCGHNVSNTIEKTDCVIFISNFMYIVGLFFTVFLSLPLIIIQLSFGGIDIDGSTFNIGLGSFMILVVPILVLIGGIFLKKYAKKMCKKNIKK